VPSPEPPKPYYEAAYDFTAQDEGEISLTKGTRVEVVEKEENGWWLIRVDGKEGWAPSSYLVEVKPPSRPPPPKRRPMPVPPTTATAAASSPPTSTSPVAQPEPPAPAPVIAKVATSTAAEPTPEPTPEPVRVIPVATSSEDNIPAWKKELMARRAAKVSHYLLCIMHTYFPFD
jgi:myosin-1